MQSLNCDHVAVSKLCCLTCRIFLRLLSTKESGNFSIRGHHSTLYLVDLPRLLPLALLQEMTTMLQGYLGEEFKKIIFPSLTFETHARSHLIKHDRALSTGSKEEGVILQSHLITLAITLADGLRTVGLFFVPHDHGAYLWHARASLQLCQASNSPHSGIFHLNLLITPPCILFVYGYSC